MKFINEVLAQGSQVEKLRGLDQTAGNAGFVEKTVTDFAGSALNLIISFVGILFLVLMIYGGVLWMTARGNIEQVGRARKLIVAGLIGLLVVLSAFAVTAYLGDVFASQSIQGYDV